MSDEWMAKYIEKLEQRLQGVEKKLDRLLEKDAKRAGANMVVSVIVTLLFQAALVMIQMKLK